MKKFFAALLVLFSATTALNAAVRTDSIIAEINNPTSEKVLVAVHRGDWRQHPENSIPAIESAIAMGADIVEIDLALTSDSVLVVCHDRTLDRTTNGHGNIADHTYAQIQDLRLLTAHAATATSLKMPTLREALEVCKDRIVVNIDKGYQYYDLVQKLADELGVTGQLLIKGGIAPDDVHKKFEAYDTNMMFMPIAHPLTEKGDNLIKAYTTPGNTPPAIELCWNVTTPQVWETMDLLKKNGIKVWANTLWPSLNGGLCDDEALYGNPDNIYGQLVGHGVTMIQTDRPELLLAWLRSNGLHD